MKICPERWNLMSVSACVAYACLSAPLAEASSYRVIYQFKGAPDGAEPLAGLAKDGEGRLYGTTNSGGSDNSGTVFRLTKPASGSGAWTEEVLHSFSGLADGGDPDSLLLVGPSDEIYGTTLYGGAVGPGIIYLLSNLPGWPLTVLHSFGSPPDGGYTDTGVVFGANGLLYGDSPTQSLKDEGMSFSVAPTGDAVEYAIIDKFGIGPGGTEPSQLVATAKGKLYGTASRGGTLYGGTAFSLSLDSKGAWRQRTLYNFGAPGDIAGPRSPLLIGHGALEGSLFGCDPGGSHGMGAVFRLDPPQQANTLWTETILYNFGDQKGDPVDTDPVRCGLTEDAGGKLVGLTGRGGTNNVGTIFELDPPIAGSNTWSETVLHSFGFSATAPTGNSPYGAPLRIGGVFYGTAFETDSGGGPGVVWEFTP